MSLALQFAHFIPSQMRKSFRILKVTGFNNYKIRGDIIKLLWWTGDGLCLLAKRLERSRFIWPQANSGTVTLSQAQLSMLLEGIDWRQPVRSWQPTSAL